MTATRSAWACALRLVAARRLSAAQLRERLLRREYPMADVDACLVRAVELGYIDDRLYVEVYIQAYSRTLGDRRIMGNLVKRGISRDVINDVLGGTEHDEAGRLHEAFLKLKRTRPRQSLSSTARSLERLGFPAAAIYRYLQAHGTAYFETVPVETN